MKESEPSDCICSIFLNLQCLSLAQFSWTIMENRPIHTSVDTLEGMIRKKKDKSRKLARVIKLSWRGCAMTQSSWKDVYKEAIMAALQDKVQQNCSTGTKFTDRYS